MTPKQRAKYLAKQYTAQQKERRMAAVQNTGRVLMAIPLFFLPYALYQFKKRNALLTTKEVTLDYIDFYGPAFFTAAICLLTVLSVASSVGRGGY